MAKLRQFLQCLLAAPVAPALQIGPGVRICVRRARTGPASVGSGRGLATCGISRGTQDFRGKTPPSQSRSRCLPVTLSPADDAQQRHVRTRTWPTRAKAIRALPAWDDFNVVSSTARASVARARPASRCPSENSCCGWSAFICCSIVPVNWLVFRLLGRVEWAWVAVPVVAVGWGLVVIWLAQLDIGFARAETEVAVLELQSGFPRGHLTRYTALYSSLSTSYDVHFDDPSAVAQPFAVDVELLPGQAQLDGHAAQFRRSADWTTIRSRSNSTGMVHSEQMFDLGGSLTGTSRPSEPPTLENNTKLKLSGVARAAPAADQAAKRSTNRAWLGDLVAGAKVDVRVSPHHDNGSNWPTRASCRR